MIDVELRRFSDVGGWPALRGWADAQAAGAGRTGMPGGSVAPFLNCQFTRSDERLRRTLQQGFRSVSEHLSRGLSLMRARGDLPLTVTWRGSPPLSSPDCTEAFCWLACTATTASCGTPSAERST
jgi:hypothetical protein